MAFVEAKCINCGAKLKVDSEAKTAVCQFCDSTFITEKASFVESNSENNSNEGNSEDGQLRTGQTVFAKWVSDGFYYPAIIGEILDNHIRAAFLDGDSGMVLKEQVLSLQEGYKILSFQSNWKHGGIYFKGVIANYQPMIMNYNDGDVEMIELSQLRGARPGEKTKRFLGIF